jgi:ribosomal protein S18 acetylase RimI-like enzyme
MNSLKSFTIPTVGAVAPADAERAVAVLTLAFSADPVTRWTYPEPAQYLALFPVLVRAFGGGAFTEGTARHVENYAGAALWLPPGKELDEAAMEASLPPGREGEFAPVFEAMASYHPQEPHWYLPLIGVDPARHRNGYGAALLQDTLRRCDQDHVAAYLESTNPGNITLYQRHGFELRGTYRSGRRRRCFRCSARLADGSGLSSPGSRPPAMPLPHLAKPSISVLGHQLKRITEPPCPHLSRRSTATPICPL